MKMEEIQSLIAQGEGLTIEYTREWARDIGDKLASFANSQGGALLIGVEKNGNVIGIPTEDWERLEESVANVCRSCQPPLAPQIERVAYNQQTIMLAQVNRSLDVHQAGGVTWIRVGSTTRAASQEEITRLLQDRGKLATDEFIVADARYEDLQSEKLARYVETRLRAGAPRLANGRALPEIAANLGLVKTQDGDWKPTVAGVLFFGRYPQQFLQHSTLRALRFQGDEIAESWLLDRAGITGTLDEIIDSAVSFVGRNMKVARVIGVMTREIPEYPLNAVREAIANAMVHRDYTIAGQEVLMRMFATRLEIASPGGLAGNVTLETLGQRRFARNPHLADIAFELGKTERAGTGVPRIQHELQWLGSPAAEFRAMPDMFTVVFVSRHTREL
jgi:ATP-dependent DNA helicase RecG